VGLHGGMTPTLAAADAETSRSAVVADDSEAVRKLIGAVLRRGGFDVREAADGAAAWRLVEERAPDLLVVDDVLPGLSGVEFVDALRARRELQPMRVAFLVEYQSGFDRAALAGLDGSSVIWVPFDLEDVASQLRTICP
jgi:two-component system, chemotaxis family, chemotaxis protein CheY